MSHCIFVGDVGAIYLNALACAQDNFSIIDFIHSIVGRIVGFTNAIILQIKDFIEGVGKMT